MEVKSTAIARLFQSIDIYCKNFFSLTILYFILFFVFQFILWTFIKYNFLGILDNSLSKWFLWVYSPELMSAFCLYLTYILLFLFLLVPVKTATIKSIDQAAHGKRVQIGKNLMFWMKNIFNLTYMHMLMFLYTFTIPILAFWGLIIFLWFMIYHQNWLEIVSIIKPIFVLLTMLFIFVIDRWVKAKFAIYNAIEKEEYTDINFQESIEYTSYQWWRIFESILVFMVWFFIFSKLVLWCVGFLGANAPFDITIILDKLLKAVVLQPNSWITVNVFLESFQWISNTTFGGYIRLFVITLLESLWATLVTIYMYLMFKILQYDNWESI